MFDNFYDFLCFLSTHHIKINGGGFSDGLVFDLKNKDIRSRKLYLMKDGKIIPQKICIGDLEFEITDDMELIMDYEDAYKELDRLYSDFKYSIPNEYDQFTHSNFIATPINKLTYKQFMCGKPRQEARIALEGFVILTKFKWDNPRKHYWQSPSDNNLILFKEWI